MIPNQSRQDNQSNRMDIYKNETNPTKDIDNQEIIINEKGNGIYYIENVFDPEFCKTMMETMDTLNMHKTKYAKGNNVECYSNALDEMLRKNDDLYYEFSPDASVSKGAQPPAIYTNIHNGILNSQLQIYQNKINEKMVVVKKRMASVNNYMKFDHHSGYILRKHYGATRLHVDGIVKIDQYPNMNRNTTVIVSLNDDYRGGVFHFPSQNISLKLNAGSVLLFPPYWTHPHYVDGTEENTYRYTICTWTCCE